MLYFSKLNNFPPCIEREIPLALNSVFRHIFFTLPSCNPRVSGKGMSFWASLIFAFEDPAMV